MLVTYRDDPAALGARHTWLSELRIAAPCDARWEAMAGDDRVRRCGLCDREVYDLSKMTSAEAQELFARERGRAPCVRLHRRRDGTVITGDCARGVAKRKRRLAIAGAAAACASAIASFGDRAIDALMPAPMVIPIDREVFLPHLDDVEPELGEPLPRHDEELRRAIAETEALLEATETGLSSAPPIDRQDSPQ